MAYSNTHPAIAYGTTPDVTTDHFKQQILRACDYPLPSPTSRRYARVKVLLLYWDNDHLRVENEVARMRDAFLQGYHYSCEIDRIPAHGNELPTTWLTRRLVNLATNMDTSDLIIFYYAGHACTGTQYQEGPCIFL